METIASALRCRNRRQTAQTDAPSDPEHAPLLLQLLLLLLCAGPGEGMSESRR